MRGHNAHKRRRVQIWTRDRQGVRVSYEARSIMLDMLKIRSGRAGGLEAALWALNKVNIYVDILQ